MGLFKKASFSIKVVYRLFYNNLKSLIKAVASGSILKELKKAPPEVRITVGHVPPRCMSGNISAKECEFKEAESSNIILQTVFTKPPMGIKVIERHFEEILNSKVN